MKSNSALIWIIVSLVVVIALMALFNNRRVIKLRKDVAVEAAKANFALDLNNQSQPFDSVYVKEDSVFYYKDGTFLGTSVIVRD